MSKQIRLTFATVLTSDRSCRIIRDTSFDVTRETARAHAVSFPEVKNWWTFILNPHWSNGLIDCCLKPCVCPSLLIFYCQSKGRFAYWHIPGSWVLLCFLHNNFFVWKAKQCDDYSFCSKVWAEFWAIKNLSNCKILFPQAFYVMGDKGLGKQIYCPFFFKAFLFILDSGNWTFTADAIGFLLSVLFFCVINKISYPFLNLLLLFTFKGHVLHGSKVNVQKVPTEHWKLYRSP